MKEITWCTRSLWKKSHDSHDLYERSQMIHTISMKEVRWFIRSLWKSSHDTHDLYEISRMEPASSERQQKYLMDISKVTNKIIIDGRRHPDARRNFGTTRLLNDRSPVWIPSRLFWQTLQALSYYKIKEQSNLIMQSLFFCSYWHRAHAVWCLPKIEKLGYWSVGNFLLQ